MKNYNVNKQYLNSYPYYSRDGQDKFINENIFKNRKDGTFVDIGAYDGVESSNTLFFEETLGWKGVCIEPLPHIFHKLKANRENSICINKCVSDSKRKETFMHVNPKICPPSKRDKSRTSNYEKMSGLISSYSSKHLDIINSVISNYGGNKNNFEVECISPNEVLSMTNCKNIDLLSIDTEGSEFKILNAIDFEKYSIEVIIVEVLDDIYNDILRLLNNVGYKKIKEIGYDWIFKKI